MCASLEESLSKEAVLFQEPEKASGGLIASVVSQNHTVLSPRNIDTLYTPVADNLGIYSLVFDSYGLGYYMENRVQYVWRKAACPSF